MPIKQETTYTVVCDRCDRQHWQYFREKDDAIDKVLCEGWLVSGDEDTILCPKCTEDGVPNG